MTVDHGASTAPRIAVWLELDLDAQPIEGTLSPPGGPPSAFTGWVGLSAALEGLHDGATRPVGDPNTEAR